MSAYFTRRRLLVILAAVILTAFLALVLRDFVRENVVLPLLSMGWVTWIGILSVPQAIFWGVFLLLAVIIAVRSLSAGASRLGGRMERGYQRYNTPSRYGYWQTGLTSISHSSFAHERVERELQNLVLQILAEQRRVAFEELRVQMFNDSLDLSGEPRVIQDLFKLDPHTLLPARDAGPLAWLKRLLGQRTTQIVPRLDIPAIVSWLEAQTGGRPEVAGALLPGNGKV